jgi:uncharacterized phage protein (TIGR01671 family)
MRRTKTMREILFRGKRVDNGEWAYGDLLTCDDEMEIYSESHGENGGWVIPETVGEFTGLTDKKDKKIFEGDILRYVPKYGAPIIGIVVFGDYRYPADKIAFHRGFNIKWTSEPSPRPELGYWAIKQLVEVIGNIYDNPELIKEDTE